MRVFGIDFLENRTVPRKNVSRHSLLELIRETLHPAGISRCDCLLTNCYFNRQTLRCVNSRCTDFSSHSSCESDCTAVRRFLFSIRRLRPTRNRTERSDFETYSTFSSIPLIASPLDVSPHLRLAPENHSSSTSSAQTAENKEAAYRLLAKSFVGTTKEVPPQQPISRIKCSTVLMSEPLPPAFRLAAAPSRQSVPEKSTRPPKQGIRNNSFRPIYQLHR